MFTRRPRRAHRQVRAAASAKGRLAAIEAVDAAPVPRWIELEGAFNVRDLGGLPAASGPTRSGVLLRADALDALTEADVERLVVEIGLAHVVDLRSESERLERGRGRLGTTAITYSDLAVIDGAALERRRRERAAAYTSGAPPASIMATGYAQLLDLGRPSFVSVLGRLVVPGGTPALVHCTAGKDRTGILVALLLDVAGVDREAIIADYAATSERMDLVAARILASDAFQEVAEQIPAFAFEARADTMRQFLDALDAQWGGAPSFFEANGADPDDLDRWRALLVQVGPDPGTASGLPGPT